MDEKLINKTENANCETLFKTLSKAEKRKRRRATPKVNFQFICGNETYERLLYFVRIIIFYIIIM